MKASELKPVFDTTPEYGLVLEGGGARGAYQVGVWKALEEAGVKIKGLSGASVGSLNAALICMHDLDGALDLWGNLKFSQVMNADDSVMKKLLNMSLPFINTVQEVFRHVADKGIDVSPLRNLIADYVDEDKIRHSDRELYISILDIKKRRELDVDVKTLPEGEIKNYLLGSAYFPLFKNEELNGNRFMDGGLVDNVPIHPLLEHGYKDIIVIRIYGIGIDKKTKIPDDVRLHTIAPLDKNLGNILDFDGEKCRHLITQGYYDACRFLYGLDGRKYYYTKPNLTEKQALSRIYRLLYTKSDIFKKNIDITEAEYKNLRRVNERLLPHLADFLAIEKDWNYIDLYEALIEYLLGLSHFPVFDIYTFEEAEAQAYA